MVINRKQSSKARFDPRKQQGQHLPSYSLRLQLTEDVTLSPDCAERSESLNSGEGAGWLPKSPSLNCSSLGAQERALKWMRKGYIPPGSRPSLMSREPTGGACRGTRLGSRPALSPSGGRRSNTLLTMPPPHQALWASVPGQGAH